jgi:hypothetical protein
MKKQLQHKDCQIQQLKDDIDRRKNIDKNVKLHVATLVT